MTPDHMTHATCLYDHRPQSTDSSDFCCQKCQEQKEKADERQTEREQHWASGNEGKVPYIQLTATVAVTTQPQFWCGAVTTIGPQGAWPQGHGAWGWVRRMDLPI